MLKALIFGLGAGASIQAWRNWPADSVVTADGLAVVFCLGLVAAFYAGRSRRAPSAAATAVAVSESTAVATNTVNVALVVPGAGAGADVGVSVPTDAAPWIASTSSRPALSVDSLEGFDPQDLADVLPDDFHRA